MNCPDEETLLAFVDGALPGEERERLERHIDDCPSCAELVAEAARDASFVPHVDPHEDQEPEVPFVPPPSVGRYLVREALGAGAMGHVYAAFDPELDRRVAIKFVRTSRSRADETRGRERIIREARAIARLSHPNVVAVFEIVETEADVGTGLCIVMELVTGESLRDWLMTDPPMSSVLAAFEQAAAGLSAAHAAGVVHRDFKPENVLVVDGPSVEVKVMDFGLASARGLEPLEHAPAGRNLPLELTAAGTIIGTPRYMAPEQHRGEEADARSDQFAFCVALYEALFGQRAYAAQDYDALCLQKARGEVQPPPTRHAISSALTSAVLRGLSAEPDERFGSMGPLVEALATARASRPRAKWLVLGSVGALALGAALLVGGDASKPCTAVDEAWASTWNEDTRRAVERAFGLVGTPYVDETLERAVSGIDDYLRTWSEARVAVCVAPRSEAEPLVHDRQVACLERGLHHLEAVVELFARADAVTVQQAVALVQSLPPSSVCADPAFVRSAVAPPEREEIAVRVLEIRRAIARVLVLGRAGRAEEALEDARALVGEANQIPYAPIQAEARFARGWLLSSTGRTDSARDALAEAFWSAEAANDHALAARAATLLVYVHGHQRAELDEGKRWARFAETALQRVQAHPTAWADYEYNLGTALSEAGLHDEAIAAFSRALDRWAAAGGGHEVAIATVLNGLAATRARAGDLHMARIEFERAASMWRTAVGAEHPHVALVSNNLGNLCIDLEDYACAMQELERARELGERAWGPDNVALGDVLLNLGRLHARLERFDAARRDYRRALEIWTPQLAADHPRVAQAHNNLGVLELKEGNPRDALARFDVALESWQRSLGFTHPHLRMVLENRAEALNALQRFEEAQADIERARSLTHDALR